LVSKNAPAVFQAIINDVLRDFLNQVVYVYLNNIFIYSTDLDTHKHHAKSLSIFSTTTCMSKQKSEFHADTIFFLGFIVAPGRVQMYSNPPLPLCDKANQWGPKKSQLMF